MSRVGIRRGRAVTGLGRGQALVEFAFVLPVFLFILMILLDFGRVIYAQNTITQDAREASRNGAVGASFTSAKYDEIRAHGLLMSPGVPLTVASIFGQAGGCRTGTDNTVPATCFYPDGIGIGDRVVVNVQVTMPVLTPIVSVVVGQTITISATSISYVQ